MKKPQLFDCGFFQGIIDGIYDDLGSIGSLFRILDVIQGLFFADLLRNLFHGRLNQREHGGNRFIQIGKSNRVNMGFVHSDFYFKGSVV